MLLHFIKHVGLQVPVDDKYGQSIHILECLLESFQHCLHCFDRCFGIQDRQDVEIYCFNSIDIYFH